MYTNPGNATLPWSCNFGDSSSDSDLCGMIQDTDDNFDWMMLDESTPSEGTGPSDLSGRGLMRLLT